MTPVLELPYCTCGRGSSAPTGYGLSGQGQRKQQHTNRLASTDADMVLSSHCSAALTGYGLEAFVDMAASCMVLWRFWNSADTEVGSLHIRLSGPRRIQALLSLYPNDCRLTLIPRGIAPTATCRFVPDCNAHCEMRVTLSASGRHAGQPGPRGARQRHHRLHREFLLLFRFEAWHLKVGNGHQGASTSRPAHVVILMQQQPGAPVP